MRHRGQLARSGSGRREISHYCALLSIHWPETEALDRGMPHSRAAMPALSGLPCHSATLKGVWLPDGGSRAVEGVMTEAKVSRQMLVCCWR